MIGFETLCYALSQSDTELKIFKLVSHVYLRLISATYMYLVTPWDLYFFLTRRILQSGLNSGVLNTNLS